MSNRGCQDVQSEGFYAYSFSTLCSCTVGRKMKFSNESRGILVGNGQMGSPTSRKYQCYVPSQNSVVDPFDPFTGTSLSFYL
jgi:hypothetical protein